MDSAMAEEQHELFGSADGALSPVKRRLLQSALAIEAQDPGSILFLHAVFAQTSLPYRDPGPIRLWQRSQGAAHLEIEAGRAFHPGEGAFIDVGLPFGPKPRLILAHLNAEALRTGSRTVHVEHSLTAFTRRLGLCQDGRSIRVVKDQLTRLATAEVRLAIAYSSHEASQVQAHLIGKINFLAKDDRQRVVWPAAVTLDEEYFKSLERHAVPLDERALAALGHNAMALDCYAWLAQRLHRVNPGRPQLVPWGALREQFGWHYDRVRRFRETFRQTMALVVGQYPAANIELDGRGMTLRHSSPPVRARLRRIVG
jgi:hypothetical protein